MEPQDVINLFDSCWFSLEILKKPHSESNPDHQNQENPSKPLISSLPSIIMRSRSDQLSSMTSFISDSLSPNSVLFTPHLQPILSGKESKSPQHHMEDKKPRNINIMTMRGRTKKGMSKSLSALEFEELKGFMDLGFVFSEEDKDSSLVEIIPGLQRLGKNEEHELSSVDESSVPRPYLPEAWEVWERRKRETPLMNWRVPAVSNEVDIKDSLKWWAHTVASTVR